MKKMISQHLIKCYNETILFIIYIVKSLKKISQNIILCQILSTYSFTRFFLIENKTNPAWSEHRQKLLSKVSLTRPLFEEFGFWKSYSRDHENLFQAESISGGPRILLFQVKLLKVSTAFGKFVFGSKSICLRRWVWRKSAELPGKFESFRLCKNMHTDV